MDLHGLVFMTIFSLPCYALNTSGLYFNQDEVQSLSELPLDKLIQIKSSFARKISGSDDYDLIPEARTRSASVVPMAMSLRRTSGSNNGLIRRHGMEEEKGKDSKISKIFQLTVTALSFLAFGGYLLTLIVTAIKRNQINVNPGVIGLNSLQKIKRPKRGLLVLDPAENEYDTERMYRGMIMLSSDYSRHYH
ncbi:uncharacterized protein LOC111643010 [Copidosoma floridanum]|uniref:uncharacterized protein LOC111643010 n=1 Tax=Copidosoma floridanum TaxID=29053 RepID=UPI000C6F7E24|nr:uncharacterized protein LOC111643010 [Copidosoma floridanum]